MPLPDPFDAAAFQQLTGASDAQMADLSRYRALLEDWNEKMNLVGPSALATFWLRHAFDSAQLLLRPSSSAPSTALPSERGGMHDAPLVWADIGAGAGFPGVILAILLKGRAGAQVHLVESLTKRCKFLEAVADDLALPTQVHNARAESTRLTGIDVVTARAVAPVDKLLGYAQPIMKAGARGLFLKGAGAEAEIAAARQSWKFEAELIPSLSDPSGRIVSIRRLARVEQ